MKFILSVLFIAAFFYLVKRALKKEKTPFDTPVSYWEYTEVPDRDYNVHTRHSGEYHAKNFLLWLNKGFFPETESCLLRSYYDRVNYKVGLSSDIYKGMNAIAVAQVCRVLSLSYLSDTGYEGNSNQIQSLSFELCVKYLKSHLEPTEEEAAIRFLKELLTNDNFGKMEKSRKDGKLYLWTGEIKALESFFPVNPILFAPEAT